MQKIKAQNKLRNLFIKHKVVEMNDLFQILQSNSRMTVFRKLSGLEYISSYTHTGKYYTLNDIPRFDSDGLWIYDNIGFSQNGSLKNTIKCLVNNCETGKFHSELEKQLRVRVHNVLLDLVKSNLIDRTKYDGKFLYISTDQKQSKTQIKRRQSPTIYKTGLSPSISDSISIEVLVEVILQSNIQPDVAKVTAALNKKGIPLTINDVATIFNHYNIEKKIPDLHQFDI